MTRFVAFMLALLLAAPAAAQVGKSLGVVDANTAAEADLTKMPGMTPAIAKALVAARPFDSITALNAFLLGQKLTPDQANALYRHLFVHINLNTASAEVIYASVPAMEIADAHRVVAARERTHFRSLADASAAAGVSSALFSDGNQGVNTRYFEVLGTLRLSQTIVQERSLVQRDGLNVTTLWRERVARDPQAATAGRS